jgi:hypothetical protein
VSIGAQKDPSIGVQKGPLCVGGKGCLGSEQEGPARAAQCPRERQSGARGRCLFAHLGNPMDGGFWARELIAAEASGRFDRLEFVEIESVDGLQGLSGGAVLKVVGQSLEPGEIFCLEADEDSNSIAPALSAAAMVSRSPVADHRPDCGADSAMPGLSLSIANLILDFVVLLCHLSIIRWRAGARPHHPISGHSLRGTATGRNASYPNLTDRITSEASLQTDRACGSPHKI